MHKHGVYGTDQTQAFLENKYLKHLSLQESCKVPRNTLNICPQRPLIAWCDIYLIYVHFRLAKDGF